MFGAHPHAKPPAFKTPSEARDGLGWTASDLAAIQGWLDASPAHCGEAWQEYLESKAAKPERPRLLY